MLNTSIQEYGMASYLDEQIKKCRKKTPCKLSSFFSKNNFNASQKEAALKLLQEANDQNLRTTSQEIESLGLQSELEEYLQSPEYKAYNEEHVGLILEILASIKDNGVQKMYMSRVRHIIH